VRRFALLVLLLFAGSLAGAEEPVLASLCYHRFAPETRKDDYSISLERLGAQLDWLKAQGWQSVSLAQVQAALDGKGSLPPKAVLLSVDDGYRSGALSAEAFEARGFRAVYFVYPMVLGRGKFMRVDELKALEARGHEVASHSWSHPNIAKVGKGMSPAAYAAFVRHELKDSRVKLEELLGHPVTALAWPFGAYNRVLAQAAVDAGYTQLWTVSGGISPQSGLDARRLRRVLLQGRTPLEAFKRSMTRALADASVSGLDEGDLVFRSQLPLNLSVMGAGVAVLQGEKTLPLTDGAAVIPATSPQGFQYLNLQQGGGPTLRRTPLLFQVAPDDWRPHFAALTQTPKP
jgi:peptidoglycan/xylan/chitin deacetylase (PgdA/CDA1 family)